MMYNKTHTHTHTHTQIYITCMRAKSLQSCLTLCDPMDHSPPGSSVHRILQASILEWLALSSSRGSSSIRDQTHISCLLHWQSGFLPADPLGKAHITYTDIQTHTDTHTHTHTHSFSDSLEQIILDSKAELIIMQKYSTPSSEVKTARK